MTQGGSRSKQTMVHLPQISVSNQATRRKALSFLHLGESTTMRARGAGGPYAAPTLSEVRGWAQEGTWHSMPPPPTSKWEGGHSHGRVAVHISHASNNPLLRPCPVLGDAFPICLWGPWGVNYSQRQQH